mgnify:CR=1 FL=1
MTWPYWIDHEQTRIHSDGRPMTPPKGKKDIMILFGPPGSGKGSQAPKIVAPPGGPQRPPGDPPPAALAARPAHCGPGKSVRGAGVLATADLDVSMHNARDAAKDEARA